MLISIEGIDGAGKSTAIKTLTENIRGAKVIREPGGTDLSELMRSVLKGEDLPEVEIPVEVSEPSFLLIKELMGETRNPSLRKFLDSIISAAPLGVVEGELSPKDELYLFNIARAELIEQVLRPLIESGATVILDRYIDSTIAYQGYGRGLDPSVVANICLRASGGLLPDKTFYLKIKPETRLKRMSNRGGEDRIEASGNDFFERIVQGFNVLAVNEDRIITVDAEKNKAEVSYQILQNLEKC